MGRPRLKTKVKQTRETKYYGIPIRVKPAIVNRIGKMYGKIKPFNTQLLGLLDELQEWRQWSDFIEKWKTIPQVERDRILDMSFGPSIEPVVKHYTPKKMQRFAD